MSTNSTLYLNPGTWDLTVDAAGNIAVATAPYSQAQDIASVCRTFLGEVYYDSTLGIPYDQQILGRTPSLNLLQSALAQAALTVPGIVSASVVISSFSNRVVKGQIQAVNSDGQSLTVAIG